MRSVGTNLPADRTGTSQGTDVTDQQPSGFEPPSFDKDSLYRSPDPQRTVGPPPEPKSSTALVVVLALVCIVVVGGFAWFVAGSLGDDEAPADYEGIETDAVARFHERTADLFDEEVTREQREEIGQAVCEFTDRSTDPRTVQQHFEAAYPEADFRLLFDASANAWCPEHAGLLLTG